MLTIDGSQGEGGGQILRTSLALSLVTGTPFRITRIRAGRRKPGLMRQHLTAVSAAAEIAHAQVTGAAIGSGELTFAPGEVVPGEYHFAVGTAGSTTLVLQTVLPAFMIASGPSKLVLEGGTHNPYAPPFDFLQKTFLPIISRMGPKVVATLERPGFYPVGGGRFTVTIEPTAKLTPIDLLERGAVRRQSARAIVARLPRHIAERELAVIQRKMDWDAGCLQVEEVSHAPGPGNIVTIELESEHVTEVFTGFGQRGVRAEAVADQAVRAAKRYLAADVPVGAYLADQLLLPLALAGGGSFRTLELTSHARTHIDVLAHFTDIPVSTERTSEHTCLVTVGDAGRRTATA
ncbi:MAG TPA: RNA 3'-terminal phosphate cyclase [Phycisphaerae bacterium]|nr:RNA 3'-terminal phosphate cyclase [Phycisphaerae bacterium]